MTNGKLHMSFQLTSRSMTLDDPELLMFKFSENSAGFRRLEATKVKRMKIDQYCQRQLVISH